MAVLLLGYIPQIADARNNTDGAQWNRGVVCAVKTLSQVQMSGALIFNKKNTLSKCTCVN